jgi:hypothetical protein
MDMAGKEGEGCGGLIERERDKILIKKIINR